ncbi:MAG: hypothetical protein J5J00_01410 [Deltaproteobacteria bacterium]|nr:hypothetical protein [Deltaproteobacteria bacterium]
MASETNSINNQLASLGLNQSTSLDKAKKNNEVGRDEFLQLLITQLKNQDPMEPVKNEEFAVNLAQFSQLEQLISINGKLGSESGDLSSMAAYLGKEVTLGGDQVQFTKGDGGIVKFDLAEDASQVKIELLNADGSVKDVIEMGEMTAGKQSVALTSSADENGAYGFRIVATSTAGVEFQPQGRVAGIVTGFIPGPVPVLLVSGREIDPSEVTEVGLPSTFE